MQNVVPMEEIANLEPGQNSKKIIQVHFHHHLLPLKLILWCNGVKLPVKLWPDIGYFVKPLPMDSDVFFSKESQLPGMFEYNRRSVVWLYVYTCNSSNHIFLLALFLSLTRALQCHLNTSVMLFLSAILIDGIISPLFNS